tara:strand:- start:15995 stop:16522 length:528 start_codon:yes stop_codon:yes gene_type:complete
MTGKEKDGINYELIDTNAITSRGDEQIDQYLTFFMGGEEFGINILSVQEIRGWEPITEIPNSPKHVLGVINLRGTISPIIDLRYCFGIQQLTYSKETVVIIVSVPVKNDQKFKIIGIVVDAVSDVHNFAQSQIQASPELAQTHQAQYVRGLGSIDNKMVIILDLTSTLINDIEVS